MGQLTEASRMLDAVRATASASGQPPPPELVSKQNDLDVTKRLVSKVCILILQAVRMMLVATDGICLQYWVTAMHD